MSAAGTDARLRRALNAALGGIVVVSFGLAMVPLLRLTPHAAYWWVPLITGIAGLACVVVNQSGHYRIAAIGASAVLVVAATTAFVVRASADVVPAISPSSTLAFLVSAIVFTAVALGRRETAAISLVCVVDVVVLAFVHPESLSPPVAVEYLALLLLVAALSLVGSRLRDELEADRQSELMLEIDERRTAQEELQRTMEHLEDRVRERTEELREANNAKSSFLANMSHELRTPLNSIIGFTGVMLQGLTGELNAEQRTQLTMVNTSAKHLLDIVNSLLDLARIEAGREDISFRAHDIMTALREVMAAVRIDAEKNGVTLIHEADTGALVTITDEVKLRQIMYNLLSNAIKFSPGGTVRASLAVERGILTFVVSDTGSGIAQEDFDHIFDEYYQVSGPEGGKPKGTGLGLPVSRKLARLLGGDLEVESTLGVGSSFVLRLPLVGDAAGA